MKNSEFILACPEGLYGPNCQSECQCKNSAQCDAVDGSCICPPGFYGAACTEGMRERERAREKERERESERERKRERVCFSLPGGSPRQRVHEDLRLSEWSSLSPG